MKRFIRYLYEYQDGKRTRNVGFVKVETETEGTTVAIGIAVLSGLFILDTLFMVNSSLSFGLFKMEGKV